MPVPLRPIGPFHSFLTFMSPQFPQSITFQTFDFLEYSFRNYLIAVPFSVEMERLRKINGIGAHSRYERGARYALAPQNCFQLPEHGCTMAQSHDREFD
jgi:hypothetical protein